MPRLKGKVDVDMDAESVRRILDTPEKVATCIPGIQPGYRIEGDSFEADVVAKVGFISGKFHVKGRIYRENSDYKLVMEGSGAAGSNFEAEGVIKVEERGSSRSAIIYDVDAKMGGILASLGSLVVRNVVSGMVKDIFKCVAEKSK
ncbi:MAG: hypothetical protein F7C81_01195 [Desulfurococcales archaeon]|nr:hypothetical protein [Desulfurococcales archaeon]